MSDNRLAKEPKHEYTDYYSQKPTTDPSDSLPATSTPSIPKDKDIDLKLEKALLDLNEHKNNFYKDKSEFDKQIEQAKTDKDARIRQTFYGQSSYILNPVNNVPDSSTINSSNYYKPIGYSTGTRFRPSTQESQIGRSHIEGLSDGNILSDLDNIGIDELKERLVVAEMIMKKLFTRNKDLETAIDKAQSKIKETKRNTTQNFFKNPMKNDISDTPVSHVNNENADPEESESEIEIGCKE